jgi:hypothetical protein
VSQPPVGVAQLFSLGSMNATHKDVQPRSTISFFEIAAWFSFAIATCLAGTVGAQLSFGLFEGDGLGLVEEFWFFGFATCFVLGVISLIGFRQHRRKLTLWIASAGVFIGGGLAAAVVAFFIYLFLNFGHQ